MTQKDIKIFLGKDQDSKKPLNWIPKNETNSHLIAVGGSGSGKTETLKTIILELKNQKVNSFIIDFHNDFKVLADHLVRIEGASLHPLEIQIGERPIDVSYKVSRMISKVFALGDVQEAIIRDAIKEFYESSGIIDLRKPNEGMYKLLPFKKFKEILQATQIKGSDVQRLIAKISVIFDVDLFMKATNDSISLDTILKQISVIELLDFPTEEVKALVADLLLNKLINYLYLRGKSNDIWLYCVIDEAHRMMYVDSPVERLLRESRKYGVGIILASQRPTDFSETILANAGTMIAFQAPLDKDAVFLSKHFRTKKENFQRLSQPGLGYCLFSSDHDTKKVQIVPVEDRKEYEELLKGFDEAAKTEYFEREFTKEQKEKQRLAFLEEENVKLARELDEATRELKIAKAKLEKQSFLDQMESHKNDKILNERNEYKKSAENSKKIIKLTEKELNAAEKTIAALEKKLKALKPTKKK